MNSEPHKIQALFKKLIAQKSHEFPQRGYTASLGVPIKQGVYIIYNLKREVVHVGRTLRGRLGLRQRLDQHLLRNSSFTIQYLKGRGSKLRRGYKFKYLEVENPRERALVESLAIGKLCPKHVGLGLGHRSKKSRK